MLSEWKSASLAFLLWYIHKHIHNENKKFVLNHQPRMVNAKSIRCHLSRSHVYSLSEKYWRIGITLIISGCLCVCVFMRWKSRQRELFGCHLPCYYLSFPPSLIFHANNFFLPTLFQSFLYFAHYIHCGRTILLTCSHSFLNDYCSFLNYYFVRGRRLAHTQRELSK